MLKTAADDGLDVCFVVDTTGSMGDDIDNAKENMENILTHLAGKTEDYRVALIDYRDYESRSGDSSDYPCKVQLDFSDDNQTIIAAIDALDLGDGGDEEETVYSALMEAVQLDWRSDAKKVIIVLGDAPPHEPEPVTDYTYDDVLLALFCADIRIDYENSDIRAVEGLDQSLINVFSIGTDASDAASDFFEKISESTGGSYVGVDDASEVSDAIIDSIDQIEVVEKVTATADFGDELANERICLYSPSDEFMFAIETDEKGEFVIEDIEADTYQWKSSSIYAGGTVSIKESKSQAVVKTTQEYWFTPLLRYWQQNSIVIWISFIGVFAVCIFAPFAAMAVCKRKRWKSSRQDLF